MPHLYPSQVRQIFYRELKESENLGLHI